MSGRPRRSAAAAPAASPKASASAASGRKRARSGGPASSSGPAPASRAARARGSAAAADAGCCHRLLLERVQWEPVNIGVRRWQYQAVGSQPAGQSAICRLQGARKGGARIELEFSRQTLLSLSILGLHR